jgi:hypothetical protein
MSLYNIFIVLFMFYNSTDDDAVFLTVTTFKDAIILCVTLVSHKHSNKYVFITIGWYWVFVNLRL